MRKFELFFYKINTSLQKATTCIGLQTEQRFSVLDVPFAIPFLCYFQKLQLLVIKKIEIIFGALDFYLYELKSVSQILKTLKNLIGDINIFVLCGIFFSRYVQLKSSFSDEKTSVVKSETRFGKEA